MNPLYRPAALLAVFVLLLLPAATLAQNIDEIRGEVARGEYRPALNRIARLLPDAKSNPQLRYDLLMLRGECFLQLKQRSAAAEAYRSAWKALPPDADFAATLSARAMVELLGGTTGWVYRSDGGESFEIIPSDARARAMGAMFSDRLIDATPAIDRARNAATLAPMLEMIPRIGGLLALEHGATGRTEKMTPIIESLGDHARELIRAELVRLHGRVSELEDRANELIFLENGEIPARRGLHSDERNELRSMLMYLQQIEATADECRRINRRLGGTGERWDDILLATGEVDARVRAIFATLDIRMP